MAFDVIVFSQSELDDALSRGITRIALCDNSFTLPDINGIEYTLIGSAEIAPDKNEDEDKPPVYANVERKTLSYASSYGGSFAGSFASSYGGSYASGSGGSYSYGYKYEYGGSFSGSYASSFMSSYASLYASSYQTSFASSFYSFISGMSFDQFASYGGSYGFAYSFSYGGSYNLGYSFAYGGSYNSGGGSGAALPDIIEYGSSGIIFVNGYGINLI